MVATPLQTMTEEVFNTITHGIGLCLSIAALVIMVVTASGTGNPWHIVSVSIFGSSLIILYLSSTIYHSVQSPEAKKRMRTMDHISIYILIAGSYTPISIGLLRGGLGWTLFGLEWGFALIGIIFKIFYGHRLEALSTAGYVIMGWLILMAFYPVFSMIDTGGLVFLVAGGLCYTLGVPFFSMDEKYKYFHSIWHLFVLAGSVCHFFAIQLYLIR